MQRFIILFILGIGNGLLFASDTISLFSCYEKAIKNNSFYQNKQYYQTVRSGVGNPVGDIQENKQAGTISVKFAGSGTYDLI